MTLGAVALVVAGLFVAVLGRGNSKAVVSMLDGGAWLGGDGVVTHVNGASARADAKVELAAAGTLKVEQRGDGVYVYDERHHRLYRLTTSTERFGTGQDVGAVSGTVELLAGDGGGYVVDRDHGVVEHFDASARVKRPAVRFRAPLGQPAVDDEGTLWVPVRHDGIVVGIRGTRRVASLRVAAPGSVIDAGVVDGRAVVVDMTASAVHEIALSGRTGRTIRLGLPRGARVVVPSSVDDAGGELFLVAPDQQLIVRVDLHTSTAGAPHHVDVGRHVTPAMRAGARVYIGDIDAGRIVALDARTLQPVGPPRPFGVPGHAFELVSHAGTIYVNDPDGDEAAVIASDGRVTNVQKAQAPVAPAPHAISARPHPQPPRAAGRIGNGQQAAAPGRFPPATVTGCGSACAHPHPPPPAPVTKPGPPTGVSASAGDGAATVSWAPPASDGNSPITGYRVDCRGPNEPAPLGARPAARTATISGLTNGSGYACAVTATNAAGDGPAAPAANTVVPNTKIPGQPAAPTVTRGDGALDVTFTPLPTLQWNGAVVSGYRVTCATGGSSQSQDVTTGSATIAGLTNGVAYTCTVQALVGGQPSGPPSAGVSGTPAGKPIVSSVHAYQNGPATTIRVDFAFDPNGGVQQQCVLVNESTGGRQPGGCGQIDFNGLAYSTTYAFHVEATNDVGTTISASVTATTSAPPPTITVSKGTPMRNANCTDPSCAWVHATLSNFAPNSPITVTCNTNRGPSWGAGPFTMHTDGSGNAVLGDGYCFFGYPRNTVWVTANGVSSNVLTW